MQSGIEKTARIISIGTAVPGYRARQDTILEFMHDAYNEQTANRKLNILFQHSGIRSRYSVVPDFMNEGNNVLFPKDKGNPYLAERIDVYKQNALNLSMEAIRHSFEKIGSSIANFGITHLITVSCTGLYAPGLDTELIECLNLPQDLFHTSLNFLGCNAAFPALKIADTIVKADTNARVLIVCVELCTLHFQPKDNSDNLLSNTLFGDGAAAVLVVSSHLARKERYDGVNMKGFDSELLFNGKGLMGWNLTSINFEMILNPQVPVFLGKEMDVLKEKISSKLKIGFGDIDHWVIHPGGKRILDEVKHQFGLAGNEMNYSYKVLEQYGNMSSPTVLFVLAEVLANGIKENDNIFLMGFGPGISVESALMTYEHA
ncbi:MAG TPA: type III polyketide synthase [Bacteroidales bacterium]|nr:type III polyketide synthase [Bacteroidales bacterium]